MKRCRVWICRPMRSGRGWLNIVADFAPRNRAMLAEREQLQSAIDGWHAQHPDAGTGRSAEFLREIGYLVAEPAPFAIGTANVDPEIATMAGPQLVVPVLNARFLLNAANARWGSLYDALYGTDAMDGTLPAAGGYDAQRGAKLLIGQGASSMRQHPWPRGPGVSGAGRGPFLPTPHNLSARQVTIFCCATMVCIWKS